MPELPEVETVARSIRPHVLNRTIQYIKAENNYNKVFHERTEPEFNHAVRGRKILAVTRRGKFIVLRLSDGFIFIHIRMTGRLITGLTKNDNPRHLTASIHFEGGRILYFKDYRKFGRFYYSPTMDYLENKLGPEPLEPHFTVQWLTRALSTSRRQIKPLLLDQAFIAGLGNIYVDEALWTAKIHPATPGNLIGAGKVFHLHHAIQTILTESIGKNGTTIINFQFGEGNTGEFVNELKVFDRAGQPCLSCGNKIIKIRISQRGTHLCPHCQQEPA